MRTESAPDNSQNRLNAIFFYGLYMEEDRLRSMGVEPRHPKVGSISGHKVRLGQRGSIQRHPEGRVWGIVFQLTHNEITKLYPEAGLKDYVPEAVKVELSTGETIAALCFVTLSPADENEVNLSYVIKLADALQKWGLPYAQLSDQVRLIKPRRIDFSSDQQYEEEVIAYNRLLKAEFDSHF